MPPKCSTPGFVDVELEQGLAYGAFETDDEGTSGRQPARPKRPPLSANVDGATFPGTRGLCGRIAGAVALAFVLALGTVSAGLVLVWQLGLGSGQAELMLTNVSLGDGRTFPKYGDRLLFHYTASLANGTVYASSRTEGHAHRMILRKGDAIRGWLKGLQNMSLGQRAVLHVPSRLAYGGEEFAHFPPDSDLNFDIQILAINNHVWKRLNVTKIIAKGDGKHFPRVRDTVYLHFTAKLKGGQEFFLTRTNKKPFRFTVGMQQVDDGMDLGIRRFSLGERGVLEVPSQLGYGERGAGPIPANADLRYDIELLAIVRRDKYCFDEDCPPPAAAGFNEVPENAITWNISRAGASSGLVAAGSSSGEGSSLTLEHGQQVRSQSGVIVTQVFPGDGKTSPIPHEFLFVHYTGKLPDGTVFDSSRKRPRPFSFMFGEDTPVIKGWLEGMKMMTLGERAILHVPSALAYGSQGHGTIPPNSDLDFDVQILAVGSHVWSWLNVSSVSSPGDGQHFPELGDTVYVHFTGTLTASGKKFDSTRSRGQPFRFAVGMDQVDYGMDFGIRKFSLGERATLNVPSQLAYGELGAGPIPPNADLRFDMELVAMERRMQACFDDCPPPLPAGPAAVPASALTQP